MSEMLLIYIVYVYSVYTQYVYVCVYDKGVLPHQAPDAWALPDH